MELNVSQARFYRAGVDSPTAKASPPDLLSSEGNAELYGPSSKSFSTEIPQNFSFQSPKALVDAYQFWIVLLNFAMKIPDLLEVRNTETSLGDSSLSRELQTFFFFCLPWMLSICGHVWCWHQLKMQVPAHAQASVTREIDGCGAWDDGGWSQCWISTSLGWLADANPKNFTSGDFCISTAFNYIRNYHNLQFIIQMVLIMR